MSAYYKFNHPTIRLIISLLKKAPSNVPALSFDLGLCRTNMHQAIKWMQSSGIVECTGRTRVGSKGSKYVNVYELTISGWL